MGTRRTDPEKKRVRASLFDRLLLVDEGRQLALREYDVDKLKIDVQRSLERLLNTRRRCGGFSSRLSELSASYYVYGIPDFTELDYSSSEKKLELCKQVKKAIAFFEPRLKSIRVELGDDDDTRLVRFMVRARLHVPPLPVSDVVYDSRMNPFNYQFQVQSR